MGAISGSGHVRSAQLTDDLRQRQESVIVNRTLNPGVDLYWLPLGAGGHFVRINGRMYEAFAAWQERRPRVRLYHSALVVRVPAGRFVIEQAWPIPDADGARRGVVSEGPVGTRSARAPRFLRYEVRRWRDGVIADVAEAVGSPIRITDDQAVAQRLLDLVPEAPTPAWGRDELGAGEMWNSNSLISWLIARSGLDVDGIRPPRGGRAPGWRAGVTVARRTPSSLDPSAPRHPARGRRPAWASDRFRFSPAGSTARFSDAIGTRSRYPADLTAPRRVVARAPARSSAGRGSPPGGTVEDSGPVRHRTEGLSPR